VGFPGETEQDFEELLDWMRVAQLDRVGCFEYSPVEGAGSQRAQRNAGARSAQGRAPRPLHGTRGADQRQAPRTKGRPYDAVLIDRIERDPDSAAMSPSRAPAATHRKSTAR